MYCSLRTKHGAGPVQLSILASAVIRCGPKFSIDEDKTSIRFHLIFGVLSSLWLFVQAPDTATDDGDSNRPQASLFQAFSIFYVRQLSNLKWSRCFNSRHVLIGTIGEVWFTPCHLRAEYVTWRQCKSMVHCHEIVVHSNLCRIVNCCTGERKRYRRNQLQMWSGLAHYSSVTFNWKLWSLGSARIGWCV